LVTGARGASQGLPEGPMAKPPKRGLERGLKRGSKTGQNVGRFGGPKRALSQSGESSRTPPGGYLECTLLGPKRPKRGVNARGGQNGGPFPRIPQMGTFLGRKSSGKVPRFDPYVRLLPFLAIWPKSTMPGPGYRGGSGGLSRLRKCPFWASKMACTLSGFGVPFWTPFLGVWRGAEGRGWVRRRKCLFWTP
jgi:hypothetical protein